MTARGLRSIWYTPAGVGNKNAAVHTLSSSLALSSINFTICGWMNMLGVVDVGARGNIPFGLWDGIIGNGVNIWEQDGGSPFLMKLKVVDGIETDYNISSVPSNANWYYVNQWDYTTSTWTSYIVPDEATSMGVGVSSNVSFPLILTDIYIGTNSYTFSWGCSADITNVVVASSLPTTSQLLAQKNSNTAILPGIIAHWKLLNGTDTSDSSGNGRVLTLLNTPTDGTMDPIDLQSQSVSYNTIFGGLRIRH